MSHLFSASLRLCGYLLFLSSLLAAEIAPTPEQKADLALLKGQIEGTIAFQSNPDGKWAIYTVNVDGSNLTRLTDAKADDTLPQWTLDNKKLAFLSNRDGRGQVYWMDADGSNAEKLSEGDRDVKAFHITPNGRLITIQLGPREWLLQQSTPAKGWQTHPIDLTGFPGTGGELDIVPAPNGRRAAVCFSAGTGAPQGVYLLDIHPDGKLINADPKGAPLPPQRLGPGLCAAWAANSLRLLTPLYAPGGCDIFEWDLGKDTRQQITSDTGWEITPAWSPRMDWVVYSAGPPQQSDPAKGGYDLCLRELPDAKPIRLTFGPASALHPSWRGSVGGSKVPEMPAP